jgi:hypothetical protein
VIQKVLQYYQIFCNLSLDVVLGVLCCMLPLPLVFNIVLPLNWYIVLPLATWVIYLGDHVIDVTRKEQEYPSPRHRYIKRNLKAVVVLITAISLLIAWQVLHPFSRLLFATGCIMAAIVGVHFAIVRINPIKRSLLNNKELAISAIYAAGIYAAPLVTLYASGNDILLPFLHGFAFLVVVFINLLTVSIIELKWDEEMDNASWVRVIGINKAQGLLHGLVIFTVLLCLVLCFISPYRSALLLSTYMIIAIAHLLLYRYRNALQQLLLYRKIGEALYWLPALAWLISL